jgi:3-phenylpropionate/cinnamic acid dioxygenase small subunit
VTSSTPDREVRQDIADLLVRYATGIDRRDWTLFRTCFTDDCDADYGDNGRWHGVDEITAWMEATHAVCGHTMHRITNQVVSQHDGRVTARTYVNAIVMGPDNRTGVEADGFYDDELVPTDDGWKIARRTFTMVLVRNAVDLRP